MKEKLINFIKTETVLVAAAVLAVISMFFVKPSAAYLSYIDFRVLGILLSLMIVMAGFQKNGLFDAIGGWLLNKTKNITQLSLVLVFLCFFSSMLITNDVALITFVPFAMLTLKRCGKEKLLFRVIVAQTLAANLGSMLTPLGNPQNLYLYNLVGYGFADFIQIMLPYSVASGILLLVMSILICKRDHAGAGIDVQTEAVKKRKDSKKKNIIYGLLFLFCLLVVLRVLPYSIVTLMVVAVVLLMDCYVLRTVDYSLLFTFIFFFVFTGNLGEIEAVREILGQLVTGREAGIGVAASQLISNVPAALLLSGFTADYEALLVGVNLGGLGTLIASMASLISYKLYTHVYNGEKGKYFGYFTAMNILFLVILAGLYGVVGRF